MELADRADMVLIPLVIDGALKIRSIRCLALRTGIGNIAAGHAGAAVALRGKVGIAVRARVVSVLAQRRELVLLDTSVCEDDLFAVCGGEQTIESIAVFRFQCRAADCAGNRSSGHIVLAGSTHRVLAQLAVGARFGVGIQLSAIVLDSLDREGRFRCLHCEIHAVVFGMRLGARIVLPIFKLVALAAQIAADKVHNAVPAVFHLLHATEHGIGAGVGMVITAEDEAEACLLNAGKDLRCCGNGLGAIDGLMQHKYLPDAVGGQVLGNVRQRLGEFRAVVHNDHANLAVLQLVPAVLRAFGQVIDRLADLAVRVSVILMVTQHMDQVHAIELVTVDRSEERTPVLNILRHVVDGIAGLNTEVIAFCSQLFQRCSQICCVACLNVAQDEEVGGFRVRGRRFKALRIRPSSAITHLIVVGGAGRQIGKRYFVASQRVAAAALHKGLDCGGSLHRSGIGECVIGGILYLCLCRRAVDLGKPGDALGSGHGHAVGEDTKGLSVIFRRFFADDHVLVPGAAAAGLFGIEGIFTRRVKGFGKCTLHAGAAQLMAAVTAHLIDIRTGNRLAVGIRYGQFGRHPGNGLLTGELIACRHGDDLFRTGEGISRSGFGIARDSVAALRHRAFQLAVRCGVLGDIDDEIAQLGNIVIIRVLRTGTHRPPGLHSLRLCDRDFGKSLCQSALVQCQSIVAAE